MEGAFIYPFAKNERKNIMKRNTKKKVSVLIAILLCLCCAMTIVSCGKQSTDVNDLWPGASYTEDTSLGEGAKTVVVEVKVEEHIVTFTIKTDKETVGDALLEHSLIAGDEGQFGLYVKVVNGITADFDVDQTYWAFYIDGEMAMTGVDGTAISEKSVYRLEYTK